MKVTDLDEKLILRMADGDGGAFRDLYLQTSGAVYGFALSLLKNSHDAEDVMHDAYIKIYTNASAYIQTGKPLTWMLSIVRNLCLNRLRDGRVFEDIEDRKDLGFSEEDDTIDRIILRQAMQILDPEERQIVILHALTGMKHREIAQILNFSTGTVLSKYHRSLRKLRVRIEGKEASV